MGDYFILVLIVLLITVSSSTQDMGQLCSPVNHLADSSDQKNASITNITSELAEYKYRIDTEAAYLKRKIEEYIFQIEEQEKSINQMTEKIEMYKKDYKIYQVMETKKVNWFDAKAKSLELGAELVHLESQHDLDNISDLLKKDYHYWIDVNRLNYYGQWRSLATNSIPSFLKWHEEEPNNIAEKIAPYYFRIAVAHSEC